MYLAMLLNMIIKSFLWLLKILITIFADMTTLFKMAAEILRDIIVIWVTSPAFQ